MIEAINDIDRLLQAAPVRVVNLGQAQVIVTAAPPLFHLLADGTPEHAEIELEATVIGVTGEVVWTCSGGTLSGVSGSSATLRYADLVAGAATVVASVAYAGQEIIGRASISVVRDGSTSAGAKLLELTPSEQVFKITPAGEHSPAAIALTAIGQNLTGVPKFTFFSGSGTLGPGATSSQKVLAFADMSSDTVTIQVEQDGQVDRVTISKLRDGSVGKNAITALLTNETVALPASSAGAVSSLVTAVCTMKVYEGTVDDTDNWSFAFSPAPNQANLTYATDRSTVTVTGMAAGVDAAFIDITASKASAASITKRFSLTKSKAGVKGDTGTGQQGQRGTVNLPVAIGGTTWSDSAAATALQNGGYGVPIRFDLVTLVNTAAGFIQTKVWDGDSWEEPGFIVNGNILAPGTVRTSALEAEAVTAEKIRAGSIRASHMELVASGENTVPDPDMTDLNWWSWPDKQKAYALLGNDRWRSANIIRFWPAPFADRSTPWFPVVPGASYRADFQVYVSPDFAGQFSIVMHLPGRAWWSMGGPSRGYSWAHDAGVQMMFDSDSPNKGQILSFSENVTLNTADINAAEKRVQFRVIATVNAGYIEIGGVKFTRRADASLVVDGAITAEKIAARAVTADKMSVQNLAAIIAYLGSVEIGGGGNLRQGMWNFNAGKGIWLGDHGGTPKIAIGDSGGAGLYWDGFNFVINKPTIATPFGVHLGDIRLTQQINGRQIQFGVGANVVSGSGNYAYQWAFSTSGPSSFMNMVSSPAASSAVISAQASNAWVYGYVSLILKDLNTGMTAQAYCNITVQFGSGQEP